MDDHRKLYRVFQLISRLRSPIGCSKQEIARDFEITERTVERYFLLLKEVGFELIRYQNRYKIEKLSGQNLKLEDYIIFSLEEAAAIKEAIINSSIKSPMQNSLLTKLYALTDIDELSETLYKLGVSKNISEICYAIRNKTQVILKNYRSVNSEKICDRIVEPVKFFHYYRYLLAFEIKGKKLKQFKTDRITSVQQTGKSWAFECLHGRNKIDIFGMTGTFKIPVKLRLNKRARHLLEEEFPDATPYIIRENGEDIFHGEVYSLKGVGRFVTGLIDETEILEPEELKTYVKNKFKNFLQYDGSCR